MKEKYPTALTIAGSDSGGGAGIQADLKTFSALGVFGTSVITAITAQNTTKVQAVEVLSNEIIAAQIDAVMADIMVDAVKTGMLPTPETVEVVAACIKKYNPKALIVDPVMVATTGARLVVNETVEAIRWELFPLATLITPNILEAEILSGHRINSSEDVSVAAEKLLQRGCKAVLIKGGHLKSTDATDVLFQQNQEPITFSHPFVETRNTHGTGCTLSSAIAAYMALGEDLTSAVGKAKDYVNAAIFAGKDIITGKGSGPVNHFFNPQKLEAINID